METASCVDAAHVHRPMFQGHRLSPTPKMGAGQQSEHKAGYLTTGGFIVNHLYPRS
jgi:hypothetical protein